MATSISPVATIWLSAPSISHGQNTGAGHGTWSPVATSTAAKNTIENGKPNRKRILVAPQVPSGSVNDRCIALRATWPSAAMMVKGIQSVAIENIGEEFRLATGGNRGHGAGRYLSGQQPGLHANPKCPCVRGNGKPEALPRPELNPFGHHHVVHVHVRG